MGGGVGCGGGAALGRFLRHKLRAKCVFFKSDLSDRFYVILTLHIYINPWTCVFCLSFLRVLPWDLSPFNHHLGEDISSIEHANLRIPCLWVKYLSMKLTFQLLAFFKRKTSSPKLHFSRGKLLVLGSWEFTQ